MNKAVSVRVICPHCGTAHTIDCVYDHDNDIYVGEIDCGDCGINTAIAW